jgi:hypothetical protein
MNGSTYFCDDSTKLVDTRIVRSGDLRTNLNLTFAVDQPLRFTTHAVDEDDLRSFLVTFRFRRKNQSSFSASPTRPGSVLTAAQFEIISRKHAVGSGRP